MSDAAELRQTCHEQTHATIIHHELKQEYDTVEALRGTERLQGFLSWIRKTNEADSRARETDHVRNRRR